MPGQPGRKIEWLDARLRDLSVGAGKKEQRLDDLPEMTRLPLEQPSTRRYSSGERSCLSARSICPCMAVTGVRNWCDASPVNVFWRRYDSLNRSRSELNDLPKLL